MKRNVSLQHLDLFEHLVVSLDQSLSVLRLVVELSRQLVVLQDSESRLSLQLLIIECHKVCLGLFDFIVHLFSQLFDVLDMLKFSLVNSNHTLSLVSLELNFKLGDIPIHIFLFIAQLLLIG